METTFLEFLHGNFRDTCVRRRREVIEVTRYVSRNVFRNVFVEKRERELMVWICIMTT